MKQQEKKSDNRKNHRPGIGILLVRNIGVVLIAFLLVSFAFEKIPGYGWIYNDLLKGNMELIRKYKNTPIEGRNEMKLGFTYAYLRYIAQQTPSDAVILMPQRSAYFPANGKTEFTGQPYNKIWALRFLYPRKIVIDGQEKANKYIDKVTHVAIVNGWGYDKLHYSVSNPAQNAVLPLEQNNK